MSRESIPPPTNSCGVFEYVSLRPLSLSLSLSLSRYASNSNSLSLSRGPNIQYENVSEPCPPDYSQRGLGQGVPIADTVYWTLQSSQSDTFYTDLFTATGIDKDNIKLSNINHSKYTPSNT
jgi:hypothetical protein